MGKLYFIHKNSRVRSSGVFSSFFSPPPLHYYFIITIVPMAVALNIVHPPLPLHKHFNFLYKILTDSLYAKDQAAIGKVNKPSVAKLSTTPLSTPAPQSRFALSYPNFLEENLNFSQMQFLENLQFYSKYEEITVKHGIEMTSIDGSFRLTSPQIEAANIYFANTPLTSSLSFAIPIEIIAEPFCSIKMVEQGIMSSHQQRESEGALEAEATYFDLIATSTNVANPARVVTVKRTSEVSAATSLSCSSPPPNNPISQFFFDTNDDPDVAHELNTADEQKRGLLYNLQPYETRMEFWPTDIKLAIQNLNEEEMTYVKAMDNTLAEILSRSSTPRWFEKPDYLSPRYQDQRIRFIQDYLRNIEWKNTDFPDGLLKGHDYHGQCPGRCIDLDEEFNYVRVQRVTGLLIKHRIVNTKDIEDSFSEFWS